MHVYEPIVLSHRWDSRQSWLLIWHSLTSVQQQKKIDQSTSNTIDLAKCEQNTLPTQTLVTLSNEKPILQSHLNEPGVLMQFWLLSHEFRSTEHSSISVITFWNWVGVLFCFYTLRCLSLKTVSACSVLRIYIKHPYQYTYRNTA